MTYRQIEELKDRRGEKVAGFLTMENLLGAGAGGSVVLLIMVPLHLPSVILWGIGGISAVLGLVLTFDHGGLALYQRLRWLALGMLRRWLSGSTIAPDALGGTQVVTHDVRPLRVGGPVALVSRDRRPTLRRR